MNTKKRRTSLDREEAVAQHLAEKYPAFATSSPKPAMPVGFIPMPRLEGLTHVASEKVYAAAPEMLKALKDAEDALRLIAFHVRKGDLRLDAGEVDSWVKSYQTVIDKATGVSK